MQVKDYVPPKYKEKSFFCPFCQVFAAQEWSGAALVKYDAQGASNSRQHILFGDLAFSTCSCCEKSAIWYQQKLIYPSTSVAPLPSSDMPEDVKQDFNEARDVLEKSPKAAAALLRLAVQKLCIHLGGKGDNLIEDIKKLVKEMGLPKKIEDALHVVRLVGNNAVHPGVLDLNDKREIALELFRIVNLIVEVMITIPRKVDEIGKDISSSKEASKGKGISGKLST